jgi:hypothetical protein
MKILINATSARIDGGITVIRNLLPALASEGDGRNEYGQPMTLCLFEELV